MSGIESLYMLLKWYAYSTVHLNIMLRFARHVRFVNVQETLKGCLPKHLFKLKAKELYAEWLIHNPIKPENQLQFGSQWMKEWEDEYGVSLRKPHKRFSIKKEDLVIEIFSLKSMVLTVQSLMGIRCHCTAVKTCPRKHWHSKDWIPMSKKTTCFHVKEQLFLHKHHPIARST